MITFEQASEIVQSNCYLLGTEHIDFKESLNRVLRQDVVSDLDMPPFHKSAMDGYACRQEDIRNTLEVIEVLPAGTQPQKSIGINQCAKIMTGAMIPEGADCVLIVEEVEQVSETTIRFKAERTSANICFKGEDVIAGQTLVSTGVRITPKEIASLALAGCSSPLVSKKPILGIIATGDEIVEPYTIPQGSQIRNTNSYQILTQGNQFGCTTKYYGIVPDTEEAIGRVLTEARSECHVVLLTGGVSMGDFDLVPSLLKNHGFELFFEKVAIQPGKPTVFGRSGNTFVFGLPGNPVSSFMVFEFFVKELLAGMMGLKRFSTILKYRLTNDYKRKRSTRRAWVPVQITADGEAKALEYHGSAHISSLAGADGVITIPIGEREILKGTLVDVRQI
ncbi:MAG: molybdopterin molybdotransferase MoeA [bacterium]